MLTVLQENYQLEYSASYTGNVHGETAIEGYQYCEGPEKNFWVTDVRTIQVTYFDRWLYY